MKIKFLLLICFFPLIFGFCPDGSFEFQNYCYIFYSNATQFPDAELACLGLQPNGGHLASIHDGFVNALLASESSKLFNGTAINTFWIGLNKLTNPGNWSWTDQSTFNFFHWSPTEQSQNTSSGCAAMNVKKGYWNSNDCFKSKAYVCQIPSSTAPTTSTSWTTSTAASSAVTVPPNTLSPTLAYSGNCPNGWLYYEPTHSCFGRDSGMSNPVNWTFAEQQCQNSGGHLPSFHNMDEFQFVSAIASNSGISFYIGLYSDDNEITWKWSDGTPLDFMPPWEYPDSRYSSCVYMLKNSIHQYKCGNIDDFLCKKSAHPSPSTLPPSNIKCPEGWLYLKSTQSCYGKDGYSYQERNWTDGENFCKMEGGHLISIHSKEEHQFLKSVVGLMDVDFWIGLYYNFNVKHWSWSDGTPLDYDILLAGGYPQTNTCAVFKSSEDDGVYGSSCGSTTPCLVCKKQISSVIIPTPSLPIPSNCSMGWTYFEPTQSCYLNSSLFLNWTMGENYCQSTGGHLPSLHSFAEAKFLQYSVDPTQYYWTGLHSNENGTKWQWTDGTPVDYLPWESFYPNSDGLSFAYLYQLSIFNDDSSKVYRNVCKKPASLPSVNT